MSVTSPVPSFESTDEVASWTEGFTFGCPDDLEYAGVRFTVERASDVPPLRFPRALGAPAPAVVGDDGVRAGQVDVALHRDASLPRAWAASRLTVRREREVVALHTGRSTARLVRRSDGVYGAEAWVACDTRGGAELGLLQAIAGVVLAERGGGLLHAAAVDLGERVCAFVGPSDAGKSTACEHTGERLFAIDRVAAWPEGGTVWAASVAAGPEDESRLPRSRSRVLPLRWVLRVVQSRGRVTARALRPIEAAMTLRAALQWPFGDSPGEQQALETSMSLASHLVVGEIHTVLGQSNVSAVRALEGAGGAP